MAEKTGKTRKRAADKIISLPIGEIRPYEKNPRKNAKAVKYVKASIEKFGFKQPIIVDSNRVIIAGHTRLEAAKSLGMAEVPCIVADDLTDAQVKALRLADNKVSEFAEWDLDLLGGELGELADISDIDMGDFGFDLSEFDNIGLNGEETEVVEDEVPEEVEPVCKKGEIWQLGEHRLMCGDSTSADDVAKLMEGEKADILFTDPPYGYEYQSNMRKKSEKFDVLKNDDKILDFFPLLPSFVDGWIFVCTTWKVLDMWTAIFKKQYDLTNLIVWDKGGGYIGDLRKTFGTDYEIIMCSNNGKELTGKRLGSVWSIGKDNAEKYDHPTQKPVALSGTAIDCTTNEGDIILDLFGGSGSTMMACEQLGRKCRMMELDPHYCDVILKRYINFKGSDADVFLLKDGKKIPYSEVL